MIDPDWLYRFTANDDFPDPIEEVAAISAMCEEDGESYLLLGNRTSPPMCTAKPGQTVGICIGQDGHLVIRAVVTVVDEPKEHHETPEQVAGLYGILSNRMFCRIEDMSLYDLRLPESVLPEEAQTKFLSGQPTVKQLKKPKKISKKQSVKAVADFDPSLFDSVELALSIPSEINEVVVGLDPTAASWESNMTTGIKRMPSFTIEIKEARLQLPQKPLHQHLKNQEFWTRVQDAEATCVCIDGPCDTNGPQLHDDFTGWMPCSDHGQRAAEVELTRQGINLFWTTKNTVEKFDGASRWIARSLRLFSDDVAPKKIETHPHGAFTFLWQSLGQTGGPPPKGKPEGQAARLAILSKFLPDLRKEMVPNHDAMDAAAAALVAALHCLGKTKSFGSDEEGGLIWLPNVNDCVNLTA